MNTPADYFGMLVSVVSLTNCTAFTCASVAA